MCFLTKRQKTCPGVIGGAGQRSGQDVATIVRKTKKTKKTKKNNTKTTTNVNQQNKKHNGWFYSLFDHFVTVIATYYSLEVDLFQN